MSTIEAGAATRRSLRAAGAAPLVFMDDGRRRTGEELNERISRLAAFLAKRGLTGRRIGAWYQNSFAVLEAHLAIEWIGATRVPVDPAAAASEAMQVFDAAEVDVVLVDGLHDGKLGGDVVLHDDATPAGASDPPPLVEVDEDTVLHWFPRAVMAGRLHGVPVTYGNWEALMKTQIALYRRGGYGPPLGTNECFLTAQQAMHGTSMVGTHPFLRLGLPQVVLERFDGPGALEVIQRHRITSTMFVPGMVTRLADAVVAADTGELPLKRLLYGGAPFDRPSLHRCIEVFGDAMVQLYGRWEGGWPISILSGADHLRVMHGDEELAASCGRPIDDVEIRLRPVPGTAGGEELCVRSPMVINAFADPDGWYGLGDLARLDEEGYLYLQGRLDGQISTGAYHVYPGEIEEAIMALGSVGAARVTGEPDAAWGEVVTAYIVPADAIAPPDIDDLRASLRAHLAPYKIPKRVFYVNELPPDHQSAPA